MGFEKRSAILVRAIVLGTFFCLGMGFLVARYWQVQIRRGPEHASRVAKQSIRHIRLPAVRGRIFARGGEILVDNQAAYDVVFQVSEMRQTGGRQRSLDHLLAEANDLARLLGRPPPLTADGIKRHLRVYPAMPLTVFSDLTPSDLARVSERLPRLPGLAIATRCLRRYPVPGAATHVLGFAGRTRPADEFLLKRYSYVMPELHGKDGLELTYDEDLAGRPGMRTVRVNTLGYIYQDIGQRLDPQPGADLHLTLDLRAQQVAERLMAGHRGAMVLLDVNSGAVLAMVSSPSYPLETLTAETYGELAKDTVNRPLVNRAVSAGYLPGSIVKPLIGLAALEAGVIDARTSTRVCPGYYQLGDTRIGCWYRHGHGQLDLRHAIEQSCNAFFIDVGLATGLERIQPVLLGAGLGEAPEIDLPYAGRGLVPSRSWALEQWERDWMAIDTAYLSIGQGGISVSPLQAALYAAAIANGGTVFRPYLVARIAEPSGEDRKTTPPVARHLLPVSAENLAAIRDGMTLVVNGENGIAAAARNPVISLAGKTGTAEVGPRGSRYDNAWFIGYGPVEAPRYAIAVLVEHGVSGGKTAAPLASQFFVRWLTPTP